MSAKPSSMKRAKSWTEEVENAYRFQLAGYRDAVEYLSLNQIDAVDRWPDNGFVKKLRRKDGTFYYYNKKRECKEKDVHCTKLYVY